MAARGVVAAVVAAAAWCGVASSGAATPALPDGDFHGYYTLQQVDDVLAYWRRSYPQWVAQPVVIGSSIEGRPLVAVCIGSGSCAAPPTRGGLLLTALHHAREPLGLRVALHFVSDLLVAAARGDNDVLDRLAAAHVWLVPVVNPDAYAYNLAREAVGARMARKNRRPTCDTGAYDAVGVDLNRNYDFSWAADNVGSSPVPCAEDYRGASPASEPEVAAVTRLVTGAAAAVTVALNYHSYGRFINLPYAVQALGSPPDAQYGPLLALARAMADATGFGYGHPWTGGLYSCNGEASDWMLAAGGVLAMSPELGPAMNDPFEPGMWPAAADVPALTRQGVALTAAAYRLATTVLQLAAAQVDATPAAPCDAPAGCVTLRLTAVLANGGVLPARGAAAVALLPAVPTITHAALCAAPGAGAPGADGCALPFAALGVRDAAAPWGNDTRAAATFKCAAAAPPAPLAWPAAVTPAGRRVAGAAVTARAALRNVQDAAVAAARRVTAAASRALRALGAAAPRLNDTAARATRVNLRDAIDAAERAPLPPRRRAAADAAACSDGCVVAVAPTLPAALRALPALPAQAEAAVTLTLSLPVASPAGAAVAAALAACAAGAADTRLAYAIVSDDLECAVYAVTCAGVSLLQRGQAGCAPCVVARTAAWPASLGLPPAPAAASASPTTASPPATATAAAAAAAEEWPWVPATEMAPAAQAALFGTTLAALLVVFALAARRLLHRAGVPPLRSWCRPTGRAFEALPSHADAVVEGSSVEVGATPLDGVATALAAPAAPSAAAPVAAAPAAPASPAAAAAAGS